MLRKLFIAFTCILVSVQLFAEKVIVGKTPAWVWNVKPDPNRRSSLKDVSSGYYLELLDRQTNLANQTEYRHSIRHIINESGVQNASEISVSFVPDYQQVIFHYVSLIRGTDTISRLDLREIKVVQEETDASDFQYNGIKRAFLILKDVRKNDRIDVAYSVVGFNPVFKNRYSTDMYFYTSASMTNYFETLIVPKERELVIDPQNGAPKPTKTVSGNSFVYQWSNPQLPKWESKPGVPGWFSDDPFVAISEYKTWKQVADWGLALFNNYQVSLSASVKNRIAAWHKASAGDKNQFTVLATRFVQDQVRYLGLETGIYTHHPHDPSVIFEQRFGDCKDKAFLLAAILRTEGIEAYVALASTGLTTQLATQNPSPGKFDHVIVAIEQGGGKYKYIDATISNQRGNFEEMYIPAYGYALVLRSGTEGLSAIEPGPVYKTTILEKLYLRKTNAAFSRLHVETIYEGGAADDSRSDISNSSLSGMEESYRNFYTKLYDSVETQTDLEINDDSAQNKISVFENYRLMHVWKKDDKGKNALTVLAHALENQFPDPAKSYKEGPLAIDYPQNIHYTLELHMPDSWGFPQDDYEINNPSFEFKLKTTHLDSVIILDYTFHTLKDHIEAGAMTRYKDDYEQITKRMRYTLSYYGIEGGGAASGIAPSFVTILYALLLAVLGWFGFWRLNKLRPKYFTPEETTPQKIGGWSVVLGITLSLNLLVYIYSIIKNSYLTLTIWGLSEQVGPGTQPLILIEETVVVILLLASISMLYWYFKRRDIFPEMFTGYVLLNLLGQLGLLVAYNTISYPERLGELGGDTMTAFVRGLIYGAIWVSYVWRSDRVKRTFVIPFWPVVKTEQDEMPAAQETSTTEELPPAEPGGIGDTTMVETPA